MAQRKATHTFGWYPENKTELNKDLDRYLEKVSTTVITPTTERPITYPINSVRAIIGPHAGYRYSGPNAAYAYKAIDTSNIKRVFILGPSHNAYLNGCSLSQCDTYETPLGPLELDKKVISELHETGDFTWMKQSVDEEEHSIEMHLPYIYKIFEDKIDEIKIVPILIGSIGLEKERAFGHFLSNYLKDASNFFIISSDFCHWGRRFNFQRCKIEGEIHESIRDLDLRGMAIIETLDLDAFNRYLVDTRNTICGRHPIAVLMAALEQLSDYDKEIQFLKYDQSMPCKLMHDTSVSYASAVVSITNKSSSQ